MFWVRQLLYRKGHESLTAKYVPIKYLSCWCLQTPKQKNINFSCLNDDYIEHVHLKHQNSGFLLWINQILLFQMKLFWHNLKWILSIGFPYRNQTYKVHYQWHNETIWIGHKIPQAKQRQPYVIPVCAVRGWSCCCCCCYIVHGIWCIRHSRLLWIFAKKKISSPSHRCVSQLVRSVGK